MKRLLTFFVISILSLVGVFTLAPTTQAQSGDNLVAVTPYKDGDMLDFFFLNSVSALTYIDDQEQPVFVSIITPAQKTAYEKAGYHPIIVDEHAGNIKQYYVLYGHRHRNKDQALRLQNPAYKEQGLVFAYQLAPYSVLIKLSEGTHFSKLDIPELHEAKPRRITRALAPNADITTPDLPTQLAQAKLPSTKTREPIKEPLPLGLIISLTIIIAVVGVFFLKNRSVKHSDE